MILIGIGTDIIEIDRVAHAMNEAFAERMFTPSERAYLTSKNEKAETAAGLFCAKEAAAKAVGTGFGGTLAPTDVEIHHYPNGKPYAVVAAMPDIQFMLSISHCKTYASATAVAYRKE
jgi:holo-[acyl-carrier protein] synthase